MNNLNLSPDKINSLLNLAGQKLGKDPQELRKQLEAGKADELVQGLDPKAAKQVNNVLSNPKALEAMMNNDKVKDMMAKFLGGQK